MVNMCYADILVFNPHFFGATENGESVTSSVLFFKSWLLKVFCLNEQEQSLIVKHDLLYPNTPSQRRTLTNGYHLKTKKTKTLLLRFGCCVTERKRRGVEGASPSVEGGTEARDGCYLLVTISDGGW